VTPQRLSLEEVFLSAVAAGGEKGAG
jgi:hypothetical protein